MTAGTAPLPPAMTMPAPAGAGTMLPGDASYAITQFDAELSLWQPPVISADRANQHNKRANDARVNEMEQLDSQLAAGFQTHRDNIVGDQYRLRMQPNLTVLGLDEDWGEAFENEVEAKFSNWANSPYNFVDATRMNDFTSLIRLAVGIFARSGEFLASADFVNPVGSRGVQYGTCLKVIELDRLSNPFQTENTTFLHNGVEKDANRAPVAYNIREAHQNDYWEGAATSTWRRHPRYTSWGRDNIIHIVEQQRPDQTRGFAALYSALKGHKLLWKLRDSTIQSAILQASIAMSIESELPDQAKAAIFGQGAQSGMEKTAAYLELVNQFSGGGKGYRFGGVKVPHLFPGMKMNLHPAGSQSGGILGQDSEAAFLRYLCSALNISYEEFSRDYSKANYSSLKAALAQTRRFMNARKKMIADAVANVVFRLWFEEAMNNGDLITMKDPRCPDFYAPGMKDAYTTAQWIGGNKGQIDELKETQAAILRMKGNLSNLEIECGNLGRDWRDVIRQKSREIRFCERQGVTYDDAAVTAMINALSAAPRDTPKKDDPSTGEGGENEEDDA